jgi:hypothetical protein
MPYKADIVFNDKKLTVFIKVNKPLDEEGYHYDLELRTTEKLSGVEFQKIKMYLEEEGYIDDAIELWN